MTAKALTALVKKEFPCIGGPYCSWPKDHAPTSHVRGCPATMRHRAEKLARQILKRNGGKK